MTFSKRLVEAFHGASMAEIARRLSLPHSTIRNYVQHDRLPSAEVLIEISNRTNVSLDWLLTGRTREVSHKGAMPANLPDQLQNKLRTIAEEQSRVVYSDLDIAGGNLIESTLNLLTAFLLERVLVGLNLAEPGELLSAADRKRAERFTFLENEPQSLDDMVKEVVRREFARRAREAAVGELKDADMMLAPDMGKVSGGEEDIESKIQRVPTTSRGIPEYKPKRPVTGEGETEEEDQPKRKKSA